MRWVPLALALLLLPGAGAHDPGAIEGARLEHGEYLNHLVPWDVAVGPGGNSSKTLAFGGTPLAAGWLLVVQGVVENGTVEASLRDNGTLAAWTWGPGEHAETIRLNHTGFPALHVRNVGAGNATAVLSYDQTCDCLGKATALERGPLLFNIDAEEGDPVRFRFALVPVRAGLSTPTERFNGTLDVEIRQVEADASGQELAVLQTWNGTFASSDGTDCTGAGRFNACLEASFEASRDGRQVLFIEVGHGVEGWVTRVQPLELGEVEDRGVPGFTPGLPLVALALLCRRR